MNHSHSDHHMGEQTFGRFSAALRQQMQLTHWVVQEQCQVVRVLGHGRYWQIRLRGVTEAQKTTLRALGAYDEAERPRK